MAKSVNWRETREFFLKGPTHQFIYAKGRVPNLFAQRVMKMMQPRLTLFKIYFVCPITDRVQPRLKEADPSHAIQFKLEGRKSGSRPSITDSLFS
jgi:hypothetical protein